MSDPSPDPQGEPAARPPLIDFPLPPPGAKALPGCLVYPFFLVHMLAFGASGFFLAYFDDPPDVVFLYMHGGFAILVYLVFYLAIFGLDEVKWMLINAALGLFGIYAQIGLFLGLFGMQARDFPPVVHAIPFTYYVMYTFLIYQAVLDLTGARNRPRRRTAVETAYVTISLAFYGTLWWLGL
jgi:hypothetical protein